MHLRVLVFPWFVPREMLLLVLRPLLCWEDFPGYWALLAAMWGWEEPLSPSFLCYMHQGFVKASSRGTGSWLQPQLVMGTGPMLLPAPLLCDPDHAARAELAGKAQCHRVPCPG